MSEDNVFCLCKAIICQAVKDYKSVLRHGDRDCMSRAELEEFFRGGLFAAMTGGMLDPEAVLAKLKRGEIRGRSHTVKL